MDKPLQTELRLSDVSHFCLCLAKSCGWDLVEGSRGRKSNAASEAGAWAGACNVPALTQPGSCDGVSELVYAAPAAPSVHLIPNFWLPNQQGY